jgi:basic membrane protein A
MLIAVPVLFLLLGYMFWNTRDNAAEWRPGMKTDASKVRIGVIYTTNPAVEKSGYSYAHYVGIEEMRDELGLDEDQIIHKTNIPDIDESIIESSIRECIAKGANIIIAISWGYADACEKLSGEYPGVIFAHGTGNKKNDTNFTNYFGRVYQPRYLSGIAAGLRTKTNKVGYVAAMGKDNSEVTGGLDAFAMGVESVNPDAEVYVKVTNSWFDPAEEAIAAHALIAVGCDVIGQHCNNATPQIEAERAGIWGIGYNSDMSLDAPDAVITSVVWRWGIYYTHLVRSVIDGTFTTEPYFEGISEGIVDITPINEAIAAPGTKEAISDAMDRIKRGEEKVFSGEIETNDGGKIGARGETLSDDEIKNGIDWYCRNIVELH